MKSSIKKKKIFIATLAVMLVMGGCSQETAKDLQKQAEGIAKEAMDQAANVMDGEEEHVLSVKNGYPESYPEITFGEAFEHFFGMPTWKYFEGENGEDVVEFTGYCTYQETEVKARLQFIMNAEGTFTSNALSFNDVPQSQLVTAAVLEKAFMQYAQEHDIELGNEGNVGKAEEKIEVTELTDYLGETSTDFYQTSGLVLKEYGAEGWAYSGYDGGLDVSEVRDASGYYITLTSRFLANEPVSLMGIMVEDVYDEIKPSINGTVTSSSDTAEEFQLDNGDCIYVTFEGDSRTVSKIMYGHFPQKALGSQATCSPQDAAGKYVSGTQTAYVSIYTDVTDDYSIGVIEWSDSATGETEQATLYEYSEFSAVCNLDGTDYKIIFTEDGATWYDSNNTLVRSYEKTESYRS